MEINLKATVFFKPASKVVHILNTKFYFILIGVN